MMPFTIPSFEQERTALLRDYQALLPDVPVGADSDLFVRASALAAASEGLYQHQAWIFRQIFPDTADAENLDRHATYHGLVRKQSTVATGTCSVTGAPNSVVPQGTQLVDASGLQFVSTAPIALDISATGILPIAAVAAGVAGNLPVGASLTFVAAPIGMQTSAVVIALTGGTEIEADADLVARILAEIRNPPSGGNAADYVRWASSISGVKDAYVLPLRRGIGTVDVVIETSGGVASDALVRDVQVFINAVKPITADVVVIKPTPLVVNVSAVLGLSGISYADAVARLNAALSGYFAGLQVGEVVYISRLTALMMGVAGVVNVVLSAPLTDVHPRIDSVSVELATLGAVSWA